MIPFFKTIAWNLFWRTALFLSFFSLIDVALLALFLWNSNLRGEQMLRWGLAEEVKQFLLDLPPEKQDQLSYSRALGHLFAALPGMEVYLLNTDGHVKAALNLDVYIKRWKVDPSSIERFINATPESREIPIFGESPSSNNLREVFSATRFNGLGEPGFVYVILPTAVRSQLFAIVAMEEGRVSIAAVILVSCLIGAAWAYLIFHRITKRFYPLMASVSSFQKGNRATRIQIGNRGDEIEALGEAFNQMADTIESHIAELERKDSVRRELVENISHDLRGPTTLILGAAELASSNPGAGVSAEITRYLAVIGDNAQALKRLLNGLYDLSALETADIAPERCPFPADEMIQDLLVRFTPAAEKKGVRLQISSDTSPCHAMGDPNHIERVLSNLLDNAIRHTPMGGRVEVCARPESPGSVSFSVEDEGEGIAPEEISKIFERNFQSGKSLEQTGASGLGLAIVDKILKAHNSSIHVNALPVKGTRFTFRLPAFVQEHSPNPGH